MSFNTHDPENNIQDVSFPEIPEWDGINNAQVISPVDNSENTGLYGRTNNHLDKITRLFPSWNEGSVERRIEPQREVIWFGGIMHRGPHAMLDFSNTFNQKYHATFTYFDNPKATYELDRIADQVVDYLRQLIARDEGKEFVICGVSAGEMLSRRVYEKLNTPENEHIIPRIKHHFSVCGISTYDELSIPQKWLIKWVEAGIWRTMIEKFAREIPGKINSILGESFMTKIVWDSFFAPIGKKFSDKLQGAWENKHGKIEWGENIGIHLNRKHRKRWSMSLTKAHYDILRAIHDQKDIWNQPKQTPSTTLIYSTNDMTYSDPKRNAEKEKWFYPNASIESITNGGHVDVVFQSEKYLELMQKALEGVWTKK